ncbi:MAG TPA: transcription antitermination factor NusB, partial [Burkholderiales bacterium]|nr:transcription antitermination factor NusB [Burkholderiales bacterium]
MQDAQVLAVGVLDRVLSGRNLDTELSTLWRHTPQDDFQQRALVQDLCYGVLRHRGPLDAVLTPLLAKPLRDERLKHLLLIALFQLQHTRAAPHAVVDHAVRACIALHAAAAKGLVNAVLRGFLRRKVELQKASQRDDTGRYSFPQWWVDKIRTQYPQQFVDILAA